MNQDEQVAQLLRNSFLGKRCVEIEVSPGQINGITITFEDAFEGHGSFTMTGTLRTVSNGQELTVKPGVNFAIHENWRTVS